MFRRGCVRFLIRRNAQPVAMFAGATKDVMVSAGEAIKILAVEQSRQGVWSDVVKKLFLAIIFDINPLAKKYNSCIIARMKLSGTIHVRTN